MTDSTRPTLAALAAARHLTNVHWAAAARPNDDWYDAGARIIDAALTDERAAHAGLLEAARAVLSGGIRHSRECPDRYSNVCTCGAGNRESALRAAITRDEGSDNPHGRPEAATRKASAVRRGAMEG